MKLSMASSVISAGFVCLMLTLCALVVPTSAIECYVCKSSTEKDCATSPPPAVPAENCKNLEKTFEDWVAGNSILYAGIGDFKLSSIIKSASELGDDKKVITACVYFSLSTENELTKSIDESVNSLRRLVKKDETSIAVKEWAMKDCATVRLSKDQIESAADRCYHLKSLSKLGKVRICTCTEDKCNLPTNTTRGLITKSETETSDAIKTTAKSHTLLLAALYFMSYLSE